MGAQSRSAKAGDAARSVASNPYVRRLLEDEELRQNIRVAFEAARNAYGRMSNGKGPQAVMDDKKVQRDLRTAADSLREASEQLRGRRRRKGGFGKLILLGIVGVGIALVVSESARKTVMDTLFGAEEEFEYTSTTSGNGGG